MLCYCFSFFWLKFLVYFVVVFFYYLYCLLFFCDLLIGLFIMVCFLIECKFEIRCLIYIYLVCKLEDNDIYLLLNFILWWLY